MRNKWTKQQDKVIINYVKKYPNNLQLAFKKSGDKLGLSKSACLNRWYKYLNNPTSKYYIGSCFFLIGKHRYLDSTKRTTKYHKRQSILSKFINFLKNI